MPVRSFRIRDLLDYEDRGEEQPGSPAGSLPPPPEEAEDDEDDDEEDGEEEEEEEDVVRKNVYAVLDLQRHWNTLHWNKDKLVRQSDGEIQSIHIYHQL